MFNFLDKIKEAPNFYKQLAVDTQLVTEFNCPLESSEQKMWSHQGYIVYVLEGKKVWHTPGKSFELTQGQSVFVKQGAHVVEQFFDTKFCLIVFFISDAFIASCFRQQQIPKQLGAPLSSDESIFRIHINDPLLAYFNSMAAYFATFGQVDKQLLELKFRELILNVVGNPENQQLANYFYSLVNDNPGEQMRMILEENYMHNLKLEEFARLCGKSLSAFKRDFETYFHTTPGKWLLNRRLQQAKLMIQTTGKAISEVAYDAGFENVSHFSRSFKQAYGYPPTNAR